MSLFTELKNRNVFRVAAAYIVAAWLVIQVVETVFPAFGFGDGAVRFVVIAFAVGFIPALILSWAFEITPDGLKREHDVEHSLPVARKAGQKLDRAIIIVLTLALSYFAVDKFVLVPPPETANDSSIAVLPFANLSNDPDQEYFSDSVSYELLSLLSKVEQLKVISQSSSFLFRGKDVPISTIAEQLDVGYVLDGSVLVVGNRLRMTVQLIDAVADRYIWTTNIDRPLDDVFAVQDEISAAIVTELRNQLGIEIDTPQNATMAVSKEAHDAYLMGRYLIAQWKPELLETAVARFERAIEIDPNYALGHAELAIALLQTGACRRLLDRDCDADGAVHADLALKLDPNLAEAHHAMSYLSGYEESVSYLQQAVEIKPSYAEAWERLMHQYARMPNRHDDRFAAIQKTLSLNPLSVPGNWEYVYSMIERGRLEEAERQIDKFASINPNGAIIMRSQLSSLGGNLSEGILAFLEAANNDPDSILFGRYLGSGLKFKLADVGLPDEGARLIRGKNAEYVSMFGSPEEGLAMARQQQVEDDISDRIMGLVLAHAGHYDEAQLYFEKLWLNSGRRFSRNDFYTVFLGEALVYMRRRNGDENGAEDVLAALEQTVREFRDAGIVMTHSDYSVDYMEGIVAYLKGDHSKGLELIAKAVDDGWPIQPKSAFQEERFQNPDFIRILKKQDERTARERAKVLAVVCTDNPSPKIWDPLPETCAKYAASIDISK